ASRYSFADRYGQASLVTHLIGGWSTWLKVLRSGSPVFPVQGNLHWQIWLLRSCGHVDIAWKCSTAMRFGRICPKAWVFPRKIVLPIFAGLAADVGCSTATALSQFVRRSCLAGGSVARSELLDDRVLCIITHA